MSSNRINGGWIFELIVLSYTYSLIEIEEIAISWLYSPSFGLGNNLYVVYLHKQYKCEWGYDPMNRLNGMLAGILWKLKEQKW